MKPLIVLIIVFGISCTITCFISGIIDYSLSGRIAMAAMMGFTAIGHFTFVRGMMLMLPQAIPFKREIVYVTGVIEILAAIGLLINPIYRLTGILLIIFFILILPANILASFNKVNIEKGTYDGVGVNYLWFRIPLQILFIAWVYWFVVS